MRIIKWTLLFLVAVTLGIVLANTLHAQTGVYFDESRSGDGITAYDDGKRLLFYYYSYGAKRCDLVDGPTITDTECATATATAECPDDEEGYPLCSPVTVEVTECATAEVVSIEKDCDLNGQRWFFGSDDFDGVDATGVFYMTKGLDFPKGVPNPEIWQAVFVGEAVPVGLYLMEWDGEGYQLTVIPFGDALAEDDPIFNVHSFPTLLFQPQ